MTTENTINHLSATASTALELLESGYMDLDACKASIESLLASAYSYGKIEGISQTNKQWKIACNDMQVVTKRIAFND